MNNDIKKPYIDIVNGNIENLLYGEKHPDFGIKNKIKYIEMIVTFLKKFDPKTNFQNFNDFKSNAYIITFKNHNYNVFIEHVDSGGKDTKFGDSTKKVEIPYNKKIFKKLIRNFEKCLVINVYTPLKRNNKNILERDLKNSVFSFVKPSEIYSSSCIVTGNPSSRWIDLKDVKEIINRPNDFKMNKKKNVFIVGNQYLGNFFEEILNNEYENMISEGNINNELGLSAKNYLEEFEMQSIKKLKDENILRAFFRKNLLKYKEQKCKIIECEIKSRKLLVASHIKPVAVIKNEKNLNMKEKIKQIKDSNNGFLFCPLHDKLFDKFLITFNSDGYVIKSKNLEESLTTLNLMKDEKAILIENKETESYLEFHRKEFFEQENN